MILQEEIAIAEVHSKIVEKLAAFFKSVGKQDALVGLSGGIDSAVVAALAVEALGASHVRGVLMPSQYSTLHSVTDSEDLATALGIEYEIVPIQRIYNRYMNILHKHFENDKWYLALENLQARIRGTILMTFSNRYDALVLNTSNKSELSVGYGTLYGDLVGSVMVIGDLYKLQVYELAEYINSKHNYIPQSIIHKAPSAELRPGQQDSDSLPPYPELDPILNALHESGKSPEELVAEGKAQALVDKVIALKRGSAFKAQQIPPVITACGKPIVPDFKRI
ncbi:MAG: NAD(+) synthase [Bacteroidales bacterium]|nr:NAD(+) synthase [Bacteroidales bacterium]